ncbi:MAG: F0F1 ATP synthase subunit delta [Candidatus Puniceispirillales bacterium]
MSSSLAGFTGRYANALYQLAEEKGRVDAVAVDLRAILDLIEESEDFSRFISSPAISRDDQKKAVSAILEKAGADDLVQQFIGVVAENGRLFAVKAIIDQFLTDLAARRGEVSAEVISATSIDSDLQDEVKKAVAKVAGSDKVSLSMRVDPSLIGGLIVRVGSRMIDSSIKSKLNRLEMTMKGIG